MTTRKTYYLTTPIYYVNDVPHVGHAYTTIAADALTRARRLQGHDAFFLTGTDEHGQNIERIARERGVPEQQHCDEIAGVFKRLWERLDIRYDRFIRTTDDIHVRGVLDLWSRLVKARTPDGRDAVFRAKYAGWYCPRCEAFKDEDELHQPGNVCPDHERACEWTEEENFFFRLSAYEDWLKRQIESGVLRIDPEGRRNEVLAVIGQGLKDFSVSRARVKWGIPVPEQPDHVLYVWIDALSNYITALGFADNAPEYHRYWEGGGERMHLIGKDIIRFHCLYWPAVLHAAAVPVPTREFAQGWITKNGKKLSKTTGNVIDPGQLVEQYGADAVRYFLLREGTYGQDWDFTDAAFVTRFNADLANDLGNLVSRALTMARNFCGGRVPATTDAGDGAPPGASIFAKYEALDFSGALTEIWGLIGQLNQEIVSFAPWVVAKDPTRRQDLDNFLYRLLDRVRLVAVLVFPVMPTAAGRVFSMLGLPGGEPGPGDLVWGRLVPGEPLATIEALFPRIDNKKEKTVTETKPPAVPAEIAQTGAATQHPAGHEPRAASGAGFTPAERAGVPGGATQHPPASTNDNIIDITEFARVELRVAQILEAEKVQGSKKLIRLLVDLGTEKRQVVAGIAESYAPESLVGRKVALVANLKPAKLMGVESNGMVLAASVDGKAVLLQPDADVPVGTKIK